VQTLIGKPIGDTVDVPGTLVQPQHEKVIEIQSKYLRLFRDCMSKFQHRFPGGSACQTVHFGSDENFDPAPLVESLKERRVHVQEITSFYQERLCSLHFLAKRLRINELQVMKSLMAHDTWFLRCAEYPPKDFSEAAEAGIDSNKIVLDISAIVTISLLDAWDHLDKDKEYLISRATSDEVAEWLHELSEERSQTTAYGSLTDDGKLFVQEVTPEELQHQRDELKNIQVHLKSLCTIKNSLAISELDPKRREIYVEGFGFHTLEAVSVAKDENALLWTDDLFVAHLAQVDYGVERTWTQLAFKVAEDEKRIDSDIYSEITAKLAAWNYVSILWYPRDVITAGNLCDWDVNGWPLKQCIQLIGKCPFPLAGKARLAIEFFRLLRRSSCAGLRQSAVVQATLDAVANTSAVEWMLQRLDHFFRIDYLTAEFLKVELLYWLRLR